MEDPNLIKLAKRGDPMAISAWMSQQLEAQGVWVMADRHQDWLELTMESVEVPEPAELIQFVQQGLVTLDPKGVQSVRVRGRQLGETRSAWIQEFHLGAISLAPKSIDPASIEQIPDLPKATPPVAKFQKRSPATTQPQAPKAIPAPLPLSDLSAPWQAATPAVTAADIADDRTPAQLKAAAQNADPTAVSLLLYRALAHKEVMVKVRWDHDQIQILLNGNRQPDQRTCITLIACTLKPLKLPVDRVEVTGKQSDQDQPAWTQAFDPHIGLDTSPSDGTTRSTTRSINRSQASQRTRPKLKFLPREIDRETWQTLATGMGFALVVVFLGPLRFILSYFVIFMHELGHTAAGWAFGYPSVPSFNFLYGGGVTLSLNRSPVVMLLIYLGFAYLFFRYRRNQLTLGVLAGFVALYSLCAVTPIHKIFYTAMGHGFELLTICFFIYAALGGYFFRGPAERSTCAFLGFSTYFSSTYFAWQILNSEEFRATYEEGIGGLIDNDFVILAYEYFGVQLGLVAFIFLVSCLIALVTAFLAFRYEKRWLYGLLRLTVKDKQTFQALLRD